MIERERKFKLKYVPEGLTPIHIKQAYLMFDKKKQFRVRIIDDKEAWVAYKVKIDKTTKSEYEYEIPIQDANHLYQSTDIKLEKTRYKTTFEGNKVDIDVYPDGKTSAEIEYEIDLINIPDYCGEEITGNKEWSNLNIAKKNSITNGKSSRRGKTTTKLPLGKESKRV